MNERIEENNLGKDEKSSHKIMIFWILGILIGISLFLIMYFYLGLAIVSWYHCEYNFFKNKTEWLAIHLPVFIVAKGLIVSQDEYAQQWLSKRGEKIVPYLIKALKSKNPDNRHYAALVLCDIDPSQAKKAIPALIKTLNDDNWKVRSVGAEAIYKIDYDNPLLLPSLIKSLDSPDYDIRKGTLITIAIMGEDAKKTQQYLVEGLFDKSNRRLYKYIVSALIRISDISAIPKLRVAWKKTDDREIRESIETVIKYLKKQEECSQRPSRSGAEQKGRLRNSMMMQAI